ncbi:hypothetical protein PLESTB_001757200 [Pleodorina starrii]|uniref:FAD/NAD(P)-binding domain-containing protein n=1 Tax=Pleodorina starrii TaxID=330485 RepID=A0A9W6C0W0_9CHLO|nr:hypothetical protein PLESTM_000598800 [Pleodorina starrii]GLC61445.1 hypothetical protein PLESTB_001757200 [Pleodorina starrii]
MRSQFRCQTTTPQCRTRIAGRQDVRLKLLASCLRRPASLRVQAFQTSEDSAKDKPQPSLHTKVAIIGGGPSGHTAAIYAARAELEPIVFEGWMAAGVPPGGQLTMTTYVENFPGFVDPILGYELTDKFRQHSERYGARILTETVTEVDLQVHDAVKAPGLYRGGTAGPSLEPAADRGSLEPLHASHHQGGKGEGEVQRPRRPFRLWTPERCITADTIIIATGASAKRLRFPGSGEEAEGGFWNRGISACAICDGTSPLIRNKPVAVVGGGDSAMEEAMFLTRYCSKVYIIHRFDYLEASKSMARRALANPKIEILWCSQIQEAHGNEQGNLGAITIARSPISVSTHKGGPPPPPVGGRAGVAPVQPSEVSLERIEVNGLFFAIGHRPATDFLKGQLELDEYGYVVTVPGSTATSVPGVFASGDVMDRTFRQAITAAGRGCMAALEAERYLQAMDAAHGISAEAAADLAGRSSASSPTAGAAGVGVGVGRAADGGDLQQMATAGEA